MHGAYLKQAAAETEQTPRADAPDGHDRAGRGVCSLAFCALECMGPRARKACAVRGCAPFFGTRIDRLRQMCSSPLLHAAHSVIKRAELSDTTKASRLGRNNFD
jgi:hypothetical protein